MFTMNIKSKELYTENKQLNSWTVRKGILNSTVAFNTG